MGTCAIMDFLARGAALCQEIMLIATLMKLRGELAYRTMEIFLGINCRRGPVTLHLYANRVCELLASFPLFRKMDCQYFIVDGTCSRVRSTDAKNYSVYKHHKNHRAQPGVQMVAWRHLQKA